MEEKIKEFVNKNKKFVVFYLSWFLLHLIFVIVGVGGKGDGFWPFARKIPIFDKKYYYYQYDITEFIFYLILPIVLFVIWKLVGDDVKKAINKKKEK